jgi:hypothetical protein
VSGSASVALPVGPGRSGHTVKEIGVVGELRDMLERESGRAPGGSAHDQRRDLDDLTIAAGIGPGVFVRVREVLLRGDRVAAVRGDHCEQRMLRRIHGWGSELLMDESRKVMRPACARVLTRG